MKKRITLIIVGFVLLTVSCSSGEENPAPTATMPRVADAVVTTAAAAPQVFPVQVRHEEGVTEIPARPERIAALSGTHIEMLFAMGAGAQVIAGDLFSNYPPGEVDRLELIDSFNLNVEAIVSLDPDLVVLSFDPGEVVAALEAVGIPTLLFETAHDLDDVYDQILALGRATGNEAGASKLVSDMKTEIDEIVSASRPAATGVTFYHESDPFSYYTPNSVSFIGSLYAMLGMVNIADEAPDPSESGFPQLSAEFIVAADPDVVYLAGFGETADTLGSREGWETLTALKSRNVIVHDYDTASRWGPRVVDLLRAIAAGVPGGGGS